MKDIIKASVGKTIAAITIDEETSLSTFYGEQDKVLFIVMSDDITDDEGDEFDCDEVPVEEEVGEGDDEE